jgi:DNA-binding NarL/FixJ family response regulator
MSLRILLADDHILARQAIKTALAVQGIEVNAEASNGQEAVLRCHDLHPDIAVLDISMPLLNGIEAAREILKISPATKVIILTMHTQDKYLQESMRLGIKGYVLKTNTSNELAQAVRAVAQGETYITKLLAPSSRRVSQTGSGASTTLGDREQQVLRLISEGKNTKQIGDTLNISYKTVRAHRVNIMKKLDVWDTAGLVRWAVDHGLLAP